MKFHEKKRSQNSKLEWFDISEEPYLFLDFSQVELHQLNNSSKDFSATNLEL